MCFIKGPGDLDAGADNVCRFHWPAADLLIEGPPLDVFHGDEMECVGLPDLINVRDVGTLQLRGRAGLLQETMEALLIARNVGRQNLERHCAIKLRVVREVNLTHPARAELRANFVAAKT